MNTTTYLLEYVRLELTRDVETGINRWAVFFHQARAAFRYDDCHLLLAGVKSFENLPGEAQAIIWHCHGRLLHQQQRWDETVDRYQYSLRAFETAGNLLGQGQVLSDLGNVYQITGEWKQATEHYSQALSLKRPFAQPGDQQFFNEYQLEYPDSLPFGRVINLIISREEFYNRAYVNNILTSKEASWLTVRN